MLNNGRDIWDIRSVLVTHSIRSVLVTHSIRSVLVTHSIRSVLVTHSMILKSHTFTHVSGRYALHTNDTTHVRLLISCLNFSKLGRPSIRSSTTLIIYGNLWRGNHSSRRDQGALDVPKTLSVRCHTFCADSSWT